MAVGECKHKSCPFNKGEGICTRPEEYTDVDISYRMAADMIKGCSDQYVRKSAINVLVDSAANYCNLNSMWPDKVPTLQLDLMLKNNPHLSLFSDGTEEGNYSRQFIHCFE